MTALIVFLDGRICKRENGKRAKTPCISLVHGLAVYNAIASAIAFHDAQRKKMLYYYVVYGRKKVRNRSIRTYNTPENRLARRKGKYVQYTQGEMS